MDDRNIPEHWPDERKDQLRNAPRGQVIARVNFSATIDRAQFTSMLTRPSCGLCGDYIYDEVEGMRGVPIADPIGIAHQTCAAARQLKAASA